jgi:hypothetical protein
MLLSASMMLLTNDAGDGMVPTFDANGQDFSFAGTYHFVAEADGT